MADDRPTVPSGAYVKSWVEDDTLHLVYRYDNDEAPTHLIVPRRMWDALDVSARFAIEQATKYEEFQHMLENALEDNADLYRKLADT